MSETQYIEILSAIPAGGSFSGLTLLSAGQMEGGDVFFRREQ
jgi:hypothetical protein